jgi:membrane protein
MKTIGTWIVRFFRVIQCAAKRFAQSKGTLAAAGMAFFAIFSLFPLLLVIISIGSLILANVYTDGQILDFVINLFPFSREIIKANINQVLIRRGRVSLIGIGSLAWSATGAFSILVRNINDAWPDARDRAFWHTRLIGFSMVIGLLIVFGFLNILNTAFRLLPSEVILTASEVIVHFVFSRFGIWLALFGTMNLLYFYIPNQKVEFTSSLPAAFLASIAVDLITSVFTWYLSSGWARYNLVYGSLGAVVALMFWIYLLSVIVLFGAHLSSAIDTVANELKIPSTTAVVKG